MRKSQQTGFTLIELMASVAIIAILAGIGVPSLKRLLHRHHASTALNTLTADLALARMAAIARGKAVTACPSRDAATCMDDGDWSAGWLLFVDADNDRHFGAGDQILSTHQTARSAGLRLRSTDGRTTLRYLPSGFSYGSNATISACLDGQAYGKLVVNNIGRVRLERTKALASCSS